MLWFAEKFVSLLIEQHPEEIEWVKQNSCDLLKNSYLCLLNNTENSETEWESSVVICWKIRIFAYWTTPQTLCATRQMRLWFAEKFVSLLIEQHRTFRRNLGSCSCDLLKNSYLCLLNNTRVSNESGLLRVVICWKIRIFAYWTTPRQPAGARQARLWFAEKFVSLLIEQHPNNRKANPFARCDLLKNSYLCLLNNTIVNLFIRCSSVVICWKIRIFAYWTTPNCGTSQNKSSLWFAEKFVSLLIEQHLPRESNSGW